MRLRPPAWDERLAQGAAALGLDLDAGIRDRLLVYIEMLESWNRVSNLTAVRDPLEMISRHLLDSLAVAPYLLGDRVLDLGTGAGLPGLVLAILDPQRAFHLLDANLKKVRFVRQVVLELSLNHVEPVHARMEAYRPGQKFSTIISRAVASCDLSSARIQELLARPGCILLMKGRDVGDLDVLRQSLTGVPTVHEVRVPFLDGERRLIELRSE